MTGARTTSICLSAGSTAIGPSTLCVVIMSKRKELPLSETYVRPKYILQKIPEASLFFLSINPHRRKSHQIRYEGGSCVVCWNTSAKGGLGMRALGVVLNRPKDWESRQGLSWGVNPRDKNRRKKV